MKGQTVKFMRSEDERQYMLNNNFEIYEKHGIPIGSNALHCHNFYEILYIMEGEFASLVENRTYHLKKGDFLLVDANVLHNYQYVEYQNHETSRRILLWVTKDMLHHLADGKTDLAACFSSHSTCAYHFPLYLEEMLRGYLYKMVLEDPASAEEPGRKELLDRAYLTLFFLYLNQFCLRKSFRLSRGEIEHHPLVKSVSEYMEQHMASSVSVDHLANHVNMSKYHFLRTFKSLTGMTVHNYVIHKRLIYACEEMERGCPPSEVYLKCGFSDYSSFYRNFKNTYGLSPKAYLKRDGIS